MYGELLLLLIFSAILKLPEHGFLLRCAVPMQQREGETIGITPPIASPFGANSYSSFSTVAVSIVVH